MAKHGLATREAEPVLKQLDVRAADQSRPGREGAAGSRDMPSKLRNPILAHHVDTKEIDLGLGRHAWAHLQRQRESFSKRKTDRECFSYFEAGWPPREHNRVFKQL